MNEIDLLRAEVSALRDLLACYRTGNHRKATSALDRLAKIREIRENRPPDSEARSVHERRTGGE